MSLDASKLNRPERIWMKRRRTTALLICWTLLAGLSISGCAGTSVYVLDKEELVRVKANQTITVKFDGFVFSDRAVGRVLDAKIKGANLK